jgi:hypothetical protein
LPSGLFRDVVEDVDHLCDDLLERVVTGRTDDDIALLAVRCCPAGGPAEAGAP